MNDSGYASPATDSPEPAPAVLRPWKELPDVETVRTHALFLSSESRLVGYTGTNSNEPAIRAFVDGVNNILKCDSAADAYRAAADVIAATSAAVDAGALSSLWATRMIHPVMSLQNVLAWYPNVVPDWTVWKE